MIILFASKDLEETCNDSKKRTRKHGPERAKRLQRRLDELRAAESLEMMRNLPGRCHEHRGQSPPVLTIDLDGPHRLYFEAANDPVPLKEDGGLDWSKVTIIRITGIGDPHGT